MNAKEIAEDFKKHASAYYIEFSHVDTVQLSTAYLDLLARLENTTKEMLDAGWDAAKEYRNMNPISGSGRIGLKIAFEAMAAKAQEGE